MVVQSRGVASFREVMAKRKGDDRQYQDDITSHVHIIKQSNFAIARVSSTIMTFASIT
jgi:hypothetical protein